MEERARCIETLTNTYTMFSSTIFSFVQQVESSFHYETVLLPVFLQASIFLSSTTSASHLPHRQISTNTAKPILDLSYAKYQGITNTKTNISRFCGIRYATPSHGSQRYQAPKPPLASNSTSPIDATSFNDFPQCAQTGAVPLLADARSEGCLFLSIAAPANVKEWPVMVWIHGGGFQNGSGKVEFTEMMQQSKKSFVMVSMQYRLNSFGFLSSADVKQGGRLNAGLLDQEAALE